MNSIGYQSLNEVFFDIYEIQSNGVEFLKEKKGDLNGNPIIEADLNLENQIYKNVRFVLKRHDGIRINPKLLDHSNVLVYEETTKKSPKTKKSLLTEKNLVKESKEKFYRSIKEELIDEIKKEVRSGIIADLLKSNIKENFNSFLKEDTNQSELSTLFREENERFRKELIDVTQKIARREGMRFAESGGGTNAAQYAKGGIMDGDLVITRSLTVDTLSANTIIGASVTGGVTKVRMDIVGDGTSNQFILNHNAGTKNIGVSVYNTSTDELVIVYIQNIDNDNTLVDFHNPLASGELYHAIIFY